MERQHLLETFGTWITFLWQVLPKKLRPSIFELVIGCIVSRSGHLSEAMLAIKVQRFWNTYYQVIEAGVFSWLALARQWISLLVRVLQPEEILLAVDDTGVPRSPRKAPAVGYHHDHAQRSNRPPFLWGQLSVFLVLVCVSPHRTGAIPLIQRLVPNRGNRSKLNAAALLTRLVTHWVGDTRPVRLLLDAWYLKGPLRRVRERGVTVIGQVRKDMVLHGLPEVPKNPRRGRPRTYGLKLTWERVPKLFALRKATIQAYGQDQLFQFYSFTAQVRFLHGRLCRMVWCRFPQDDTSWSRWPLLLSTDPALPPEGIIRRYALRWWAEPLFNELKHLCGLAEAWQQTKQALAGWSFLVGLSHGLSKLLALSFGPETVKTLYPIPWRMNQPVTAGWMARVWGSLFRNVRVRSFWDRKQQKIRYPEEFLEPPFQHSA